MHEGVRKSTLMGRLGMSLWIRTALRIGRCDVLGSFANELFRSYFCACEAAIRGNDGIWYEAFFM